MKHAILILAHKDIEHLKRLVGYFRRDCYVFIHLDKKAGFSPDAIDSLKAFPQVAGVYNRFSIHWGGNRMVKCELFLLRKALENCDASFFHFLSGQDYPIRPLDVFLDFFERHSSQNFLSFLHLPHPLWQDYTFRRFQYFYPFDWIKDHEHSPFMETVLRWQARLGIRRSVPFVFPHLYGGSQWMSITRQSVELLLKYTRKKPAFLRKLFMIFTPDEVYFQTILCNCTPKAFLQQTNLRFIRWKHENGSRPAVLGKEHFLFLIEKENLLARKFDKNISAGLLQAIDQYLLNDPPLARSSTGGWIYRGFLRYKLDMRMVDYIYSYARTIAAEDALDFGCGAGLYVAHLRRRGLPAMGYDANPYTEELSALLLPQADVPCKTADLTDNFGEGVQFDLVLCLDTLGCIPETLQPKALANLAKFCKKSLIVSYNRAQLSDAVRSRIMSFEQYGFRLNRTFSNIFRTQQSEPFEFFIFERDESNINP